MSLQATLGKLMLKLPPDWLVKLSGGTPLEIGGRVLDPHTQFISYQAKRQPPVHSLPVEAAQTTSKQGLAMFAPAPEPDVSWDDFDLAAPGRAIPVRLYRPAKQDPNAPIMAYFHMGGGVIGDLETCHVFCTMLAKGIKAPVLSVDYRLAPQHKFPAGLEDCIFAYEWALKNAAKYGAPPGEAAIGGDSMGGNFSAIIANEMKAEGKPQPSMQLLIYPATCLITETESAKLYGETYPLSQDTMDWFMSHYLPEGQDKGDPRLSPAQNTDLSGLAPAVIITAGFDPLLDQGPLYADRLREAGVDVVYRCFDRLAHGFTAFTGVSPASDAACREIVQLTGAAYARHSAG